MPVIRLTEGSNGLEDLRFSDEDLELLANVSGCQVHRSRRNIDCDTDPCFHAKVCSKNSILQTLEDQSEGTRDSVHLSL